MKDTLSIKIIKITISLCSHKFMIIFYLFFFIFTFTLNHGMFIVRKMCIWTKNYMTVCYCYSQIIGLNYCQYLYFVIFIMYFCKLFITFLDWIAWMNIIFCWDIVCLVAVTTLSSVLGAFCFKVSFLLIFLLFSVVLLYHT